jgi:hypothetical protein
METFCEIILDLENDLSRMKEVSENVPEQLEYAVGQCKVALDRMRKLAVSEGFPDQMSEIYFFKKIKPAVYSKLLYYLTRSILCVKTMKSRWKFEETTTFLMKNSLLGTTIHFRRSEPTKC